MSTDFCSKLNGDDLEDCQQLKYTLEAIESIIRIYGGIKGIHQNSFILEKDGKYTFIPNAPWNNLLYFISTLLKTEKDPAVVKCIKLNIVIILLSFTTFAEQNKPNKTIIDDLLTLITIDPKNTKKPKIDIMNAKQTLASVFTADISNTCYSAPQLIKIKNFFLNLLGIMYDDPSLSHEDEFEGFGTEVKINTDQNETSTDVIKLNDDELADVDLTQF